MKKVIFFILTALFFPSLNILAQDTVTDPQTNPVSFTESYTEYSSDKSTALGVDPAIIEVVLSKEDPAIQQILLTNITNKPIPVKVTKQGFTFAEKAEIPKDLIPIYDASAWVSMEDDDKDFILQPYEKRYVTIKITQPKNASPGGHYASIVFQPLIPQEFINEQSLFIYARVAVLLFMQVRGDIVEDIKFRSISLPRFSESSPVVGEVVLKNEGNTHTRPHVKVIFTDELLNRVVSSYNLVPSVVLPGLEKKLNIEFTQKDTLGYFSVKSEATYGADNIKLESEKFFFFVIPYRILIIFFIIMIVALKGRKRIKKALQVLIFNKQLERTKPQLNFSLEKKI